MKKEDNMKQTDKILMYMQTEGEITQAVASDIFGCTRLAARISDLRKAGHKIGRRIEKGTNRYGEVVHYAVYWLEVAA
jgi:hypothetical protein